MLGYVTDSVTFQLSFRTEPPSPLAYPQRLAHPSGQGARDSTAVSLGGRYLVQVVAAREALGKGVLARVTMNHMGKRPHRVLEGYWWPKYLNDWGYDPADTVMWLRRPPGWRPARDSTEAEDDTSSSFVEPVRLYFWALARRDSMIARIEVDPGAMGRPVWLPGARRWTKDADETAHYTVAAAFYWIREASLFNRIPRRPGREDTEKTWRYAEELLRAPVEGE